MKIGDYVVYSTARGESKFRGTNKDIWVIKELLASGNARLQSVVRDRKFDTHTNNLTLISDLIVNGSFKKEYFNKDSYNTFMDASASLLYEEYTTIVGDTKMNRGDTMIKRTTDANVNAAKVAATIATGRTVNSVLVNKFRKQIPALVRGYADTPLGAVVIANMFDFAVKQFAADNAKFNYVSDAMMQAAMVDLLAEFDFEGIMDDVLNGVTLGDNLEQKA